MSLNLKLSKRLKISLCNNWILDTCRDFLKTGKNMEVVLYGDFNNALQ